MIYLGIPLLTSIIIVAHYFSQKALSQRLKKIYLLLCSIPFLIFFFEIISLQFLGISLADIHPIFHPDPFYFLN